MKTTVSLPGCAPHADMWCPIHSHHDCWTHRHEGLFGGLSCDHCHQDPELGAVQFPIQMHVVAQIRADDLRAMKRIVQAAVAYLVAHGPCDNADPEAETHEDRQCPEGECSLCDLDRAAEGWRP